MQFFKVTLLSLAIVSQLAAQQKIDRYKLVNRHNLHNETMDSLSSLTLGNGRFAFTVDATGLQSFPEAYAGGVPLGTQSEWGWHDFPNRTNASRNASLKTYELEGRKISYMVQQKSPEISKEATEYFRVNPHRLQLGNIGIEIKKSNGELATVDDIKDIHQILNLWNGFLVSEFKVEGVPVKVFTVAHQLQDAIAFRIESPLLSLKRLAIRIRFPYPNGLFKDVGINWEQSNQHQSVLSTNGKEAEIKRILDASQYWVKLNWNQPATIEQFKEHYFLLKPASENTSIEATIRFENRKSNTILPSFSLVKKSSEMNWTNYWKSGAAVDFSASTNPQAFELERRTVLSQYIMKVQESGSFPPQETGLTYNSWYGKPHLEMHWWHAVHYAQWGRPEYLEKSLDWYFTVADKAYAIARRQGFEGLRWQKMTDHQGEETPSSVGAFLIWQQPHFIYMAEMLYRSKKKDSAVLKKYARLLYATADFMAGFPSLDAVSGKYNLGKGLIPAQECFEAVKTFNPTYELAYWSWGLQMAQQWRLRQGLPREKTWDRIIDSLAVLPQKDGLYLATESTPDCYTNPRYLDDHPAVLGAYASLPAVHGMDTVVMWNTFKKIREIWHWNDTWGWDYPVAALCAARLHQPEAAVEALLMPVQKNTYLKNGHNYQDGRLTIYLPGNGGLLSAVAFMCTGGDADKKINIGFPASMGWKVRWEGLVKMF